MCLCCNEENEGHQKTCSFYTTQREHTESGESVIPESDNPLHTADTRIWYWDFSMEVTCN